MGASRWGAGRLRRGHMGGVGEQSKAWRWQKLQPWQGAERSRVPGKLLLGLVFLAPLSSLGSSVLTLVFPFGLSFSLQMCCVLQPWETLLCLRCRVSGYVKPVKGAQCPALRGKA